MWRGRADGNSHGTGCRPGVACQLKRPSVQAAAKHTLEADLRGILKWLGEPVSALAEIRPARPTVEGEH